MSEGYLAVALGGATGALLRAGLIEFARAGAPGPPPVASALGTLTSNTLACALLGIWASGSLAVSGEIAHVENFLTIGLSGGLSTFSTLSGDVAVLRQTQSNRASAVYLLGNLLLGLAGFRIGLIVGS